MMALRQATALGIVIATIVPASATDRREARSPDGRLTAWVKPVDGPSGASGEPATALWLTDVRTGVSLQVFRGTGSNDPKRDRASLANPDFSLDGGYVYVEADAYATSPAVHQIDVRTGTARYVTDGGLYGVLRSGPWRGYLVVQQHRYRRARAGSYDPYVVVRSDGRQVAVVPGTTGQDPDRPLATWLRSRGWKAS